MLGTRALSLTLGAALALGAASPLLARAGDPSLSLVQVSPPSPRAQSEPLPSLPVGRLHHDNQVDSVLGLEPFLARLEADLKGARTSIHVDYYILGGQSGSRVARLLAQRATEGIDVKVLIDRHRGTVPRLRSEVAQAVAVLEAGKVPLRYAVTRKGGTVLHRWTEDHNKMVVVDGQVGWTGGANISDSFSRFHDLMVRVEGPAARDMEQLFAFDWDVAGRGQRPQVPDLAYTGQGLPVNGSSEGKASVRVVSTGVGRLSFEGAVVNAIRSARRSIQVQQHQFGYDLLIDELIAAHRRGVEVRVLLDPCNIDQFIPLINHGPRAIFNAHAAIRLSQADVPVRVVKVEETFDAYHMKLGIFDETTMLVGSGNWERMGCDRATETVLEVAGGPAVTSVVAWQNRLWTHQSEPPRAGFTAHMIHLLMNLYF